MGRRRHSGDDMRLSSRPSASCWRGGLILSADLVMVPLIVWEVLEAARGRTCCAN